MGHAEGKHTHIPDDLLGYLADFHLGSDLLPLTVPTAADLCLKRFELRKRGNLDTEIGGR
jgi:hypothetical protein